MDDATKEILEFLMERVADLENRVAVLTEIVIKRKLVSSSGLDARVETLRLEKYIEVRAELLRRSINKQLAMRMKQ
jgi:hypothetical protein